MLLIIFKTISFSFFLFSFRQIHQHMGMRMDYLGSIFAPLFCLQREGDPAQRRSGELALQAALT
jgi:hypothetical protein